MDQFDHWSMASPAPGSADRRVAIELNHNDMLGTCLLFLHAEVSTRQFVCNAFCLAVRRRCCCSESCKLATLLLALPFTAHWHGRR
jgi:hypothetical protein